LKVILLAGGLGTRISEETADKPKPMVPINGKPILWHIMNIYAKQGLTDFVVATGYKGEVIAEWVDSLETDWKISTVDTGLETQTGGRIKKCMDLYSKERVFATYGDGVGNINVKKLLAFHERHGKLATLSAVRPPARFGYLDLVNGQVMHFGEKNQSAAGWINGGYFVLEPQVADYIKSNAEPFEVGALPRLASSNELMAFEHDGFWQPMDTLRDKELLENLLRTNKALWIRQ
jgi:glucose-1-phosphate cytidylyltransferase